MLSVITCWPWSVGVGSIAWFVATASSGCRRRAPQEVASPTRAARAELYGNEVNDELVVKPGAHLVHGLTMVDHYGVDGGVNGIAARSAEAVGRLRRLQTGFVRSYALSLFGGAILVAVALLAVNEADMSSSPA